MLLILLFNAIFVIFVVAANLSEDKSGLQVWLRFFASLIGYIFLILCVSAIKVNIDRGAMEAEWSERYSAIYSQALYEMYDSDSAKKELADQIMEWNIDYETYWEKKENIWISCFYPIRIENYRSISIELLGTTERGVG